MTRLVSVTVGRRAGKLVTGGMEKVGRNRNPEVRIQFCGVYSREEDPMKQLLLILVLALTANAQSSATQKAASPDDKSAKLIEMQNEWLKAGSEGDNATIRNLLAQKWLAMAPSGYIMHYSDFEADHNDSRLPKLTMQNPTVEFYGNTAVLMSHLVTGKSDGPTFNVTTVFQDRMGKWEMIATHLSSQAEHGQAPGGE